MFNLNDQVLVTAKVLRKKPETSEPETLNLANEEGVVRKRQVYEGKPEKNSYHVETQYGVHMVPESKMELMPEE